MLQVAVAALGDEPPVKVSRYALKFIDLFLKCCPRPLTLM